MTDRAVREPQHLQPRWPWWRVGTAWFAVLSLGTAMLGSIAMAVVAVRGADTVLTEAQQRIGPHESPGPNTPARLARNHAQTAKPVVSDAKPSASSLP